MRFDELNLAPEILRAIAQKGYEIPTPIQLQAIPIILSGADLMGGAQTGTGKTAAFTLPLLQRILPSMNSSPSPARHPVRLLMLAPTRELALQVYESVKDYSAFLPVRSLCVFGGIDIKPQIEEIRRGMDVLVATPGRLLDLVEQKCVNLSQVQGLVLDEADRMLDMGFIPDITRILNLLPANRQSLLFSATFSDEIKKLADRMLKSPVLIEVAQRNTVSETITHRVHPVSRDDKRSLLIHLLRSEDINQVLVFARTKQETSRLARELQRAEISADSIHGDKSQQERLKALESFKNGTTTVLVATDVAARGLDIDDLPHVINYELPHTPEDYVHRIGRTGRAGRSGTAISLVNADEIYYLVAIEKLVNKAITQEVVSGFLPDADYEYPPNPNQKKRRPIIKHLAKSTPDKRTRQIIAPSHAQREPKKNATIAADGFDFSKPYESKLKPPQQNTTSSAMDTKASQTPRKASLLIASLLGGRGK